MSEKLNAAQSPPAPTKTQLGTTGSSYDKDPKRATSQPASQPTASSTPTSLFPVEHDTGSLFGSFLNKKPVKKPGVLETPPAILKATGSLSEREYVEIEIIKLLLISYYNIVKRTICDMVPKSIMLHLVNYTKEDMQKALLADLYKPDLSEELLKESDSVMSRRKECRKMIDALQKADDIISTV